MKKQNMNWFVTVLRVVICFIILTDLTELSVEVLCGWSVRISRRSRCEEKEERQELKLGDAQGTPSKYSRRLKRLSLGMPRTTSHLSSTSISKFLLLHMSCAILAMSFYFVLLAAWLEYQDLKFLNVRESSHSCTIIRLLIDLHLYLSE